MVSPESLDLVDAFFLRVAVDSDRKRLGAAAFADFAKDLPVDSIIRASWLESVGADIAESLSDFVALSVLRTSTTVDECGGKNEADSKAVKD